MIKVLVADDDASIRKLISAHLKRHGYEAIPVENGQQALDYMADNHVDLVISDVMMPEMDGYELTRDIRSFNARIPILIITVKDAFADKQEGFRSGTDDYMTKPIDFDEMILRLEALLRRSKIMNDRKIMLKNLCIDYDLRVVTSSYETIALPKKEFDLLFKLLSYPQQIFTRQQLMDEIWGMDSEADERTVDVHIKRLREKFDRYDDFEIITVRGLGYRIERRG